VTATLRVEQCLKCNSAAADDVKHALGQGALDEARNLTPSGLPIMCCRVRVAGAMPTNQPTYERRP
jgi:hypothetical protein